MSRILLSLLLLALALTPSSSAESVTMESLLREQADLNTLARWPQPAYRQLQASSYNRQSTARDQADQGLGGWFADGDGVGFLREETNGGRHEWVIMEHQGPGCVTKLWTPYFYRDFNNRVGPRIRVYLDGSSTPVIDATFIELLTRNEWSSKFGDKPDAKNTFIAPSPFADFTARAGNFYLPIPFGKGCKITLSEQPFYYIVNYRAYASGTKVESFVLDDLKQAAIVLNETASELLRPVEPQGVQAFRKEGVLKAGQQMNLPLAAGSNAVRHLEVVLDPKEIAANPQLLRSTVLRMSFDKDETVWCPLGDFFCSANALNPVQTWTRSVTADGRLVCRWSMPYRDRAEVSLVNTGQQPVHAKLLVRTDNWRWDDRSMHFCARWRSDHVQPGDKFVDWNFIDITGRGVFVGDTWTVLNLTRGWWGEGDEKIYVDDSYEVDKFPDHFGTGTEDYYGWAGGVNPTDDDHFNHPFLANASVGSTDESNTLGFNISTRIRSLDAIPFTKRLVFDMEASPGTSQRNRWNLLGYSAVSVFYALPGATNNRPANPEGSSKPIMSLNSLLAQSEQIQQSQARQIVGAVELERLPFKITAGQFSAGPQTPDPSFRPDEVLSGGQHLFVAFKKPGDTLEFRVTEQFTPKHLTLHVTKCYDFGVIDIYVNDELRAEAIDLFSTTLSVQEVELGLATPLDNAFTISIRLREANSRSTGARTLAGLDCLEMTE